MTNKILNEMSNLKINIYKIQCKNWILSKGNGTSAAGRTLEAELGKLEDHYALPDYNEIELKTRNKNSKHDLHLFNCTFDNKPLEMKRLLKIGGYPDKANPNFNVFNVTIDSLNKKTIRKYSYRLAINNKKEKLELRIFYNNTNNIYTVMSWSYEELKKRLSYKMKYLCIILVRSSVINKKEYFKYENPIFYELKDFQYFIKLIKEGKIRVTFKISYYHSPERYGEYYDKGTGFDIEFESIGELYKKINI